MRFLKPQIIGPLLGFLAAFTFAACKPAEHKAPSNTPTFARGGD